VTSKDEERSERKGGRLAISKLMMIRGRETKRNIWISICCLPSMDELLPPWGWFCGQQIGKKRNNLLSRKRCHGVSQNIKIRNSLTNIYSHNLEIRRECNDSQSPSSTSLMRKLILMNALDD
jgi:hypothetical protein